MGDFPIISGMTPIWSATTLKKALKHGYDVEKVVKTLSKAQCLRAGMMPKRSATFIQSYQKNTTFLEQDKNQTNCYKSIKRHSRRNTFKTQSLVRNKLQNHCPNRWTDGLLKRSAATLKLATNPKFQSMRHPNRIPSISY